METQSSKVLLKNTFIISVGSMGAGVLKLFNVLLFTYFVAVDQVGEYDVAVTYANLFMPIACISMHEAVYRWFLDEDVSKEDSALTSFLISLATLAVFEGVALFVTGLTQYPYRIEIMALVAAECFYSYSSNVARGLHDNRMYAIQGILYAVVLLVSNVLLVAMLSLQASGLIWSVVAASIAATAFVFVAKRFFTRYAFKGRFDKKMAIDMVKYAAPITPNTIAWWLVSGSNRVIINMTLGAAANGIFAIASRLPSMLSVITSFFYKAWQEQAITGYEDEGRDAYYTKIFNAYAMLLLSGVVVLLPVSKFIILLINPDFRDAYLYLGPLFLSSVFSALAAFYGTGYLSSKQTAGAFTTTIAGAAVNVAVTLFLVGHVGLFAAAFGNMLGNLAILVVRAMRTRRFFKIDVSFRTLALPLAACVAMAFLLANDSVVILAGLTVVAIIFFLIVNRSYFRKGLAIVKRKVEGRRD